MPELAKLPEGYVVRTGKGNFLGAGLYEGWRRNTAKVWSTTGTLNNAFSNRFGRNTTKIPEDWTVIGLRSGVETPARQFYAQRKSARAHARREHGRALSRLVADTRSFVARFKNGGLTADVSYFVRQASEQIDCIDAANLIINAK